MGALEAGLDGPATRRLGALEHPTYFEVAEVLPRAMQELGLAQITEGEAALRLAKNIARDILTTGKDSLKYLQTLESLWIRSGYPRQIGTLGTLCDDVYLARGNSTDEQICEWVLSILKDFVK